MNLLKPTSFALAALLVVGLVAPTGAAQISTSASVSNLLPEVTGIAVGTTIDPTAGTTTSVPITVTAADGNGFQDLSAVRVTVYKPDGTTVHRATGAATSNGDGSGTSQTYAYSFDMDFYDDAGVYTIKAEAEDATTALSTLTSQTFTYTQLAALSLSTSSLALGALDPGARSGTQTVGVTNKGNVQIDIETSGTALDDGAGNEIAASNMKYDLVDNTFANEQALTTSAFTNAGFDLAKGPSSSKNSYWELDTPSGEDQYLPAGSYAGTVTISALQG